MWHWTPAGRAGREGERGRLMSESQSMHARAGTHSPSQPAEHPHTHQSVGTTAPSPTSHRGGGGHLPEMRAPLRTRSIDPRKGPYLQPDKAKSEGTAQPTGRSDTCHVAVCAPSGPSTLKEPPQPGPGAPPPMPRPPSHRAMHGAGSRRHVISAATSLAPPPGQACQLTGQRRVAGCRCRG